jgi:acyl dehydratase
LRHFEDFAAGQTFRLGEHRVTRDEIVSFARRFDPQPFHLDEEAARDSMFAGLVASGWHTASVFMRLYVDGLLADSAGMGSPGVEEIRWLVPVRPDDVLRGSVEVLDARASERHADRGTLRLRCELVNQRDEVVLRMVARTFFRRRAPGSTLAGELPVRGEQ